MNKKKKTQNQHPVHKQPMNPPQTKTAVGKEKKQEAPKPDGTTEKNMTTPQPAAVNPPKQKVVNEQEENQVVNDMEETNDVVEN